MALVPEGTYSVTINGDGDAGSEIRTPVHLKAYCIGRYEVTTAEYFECYNRTICSTFPTAAGGVPFEAPDRDPTDKDRYSSLCNGLRYLTANKDATFARHPMNCVDWASAKEYCQKHGYRLPDEAEWDAAATAGRPVPFAWGDAPPSSAHLNAASESDIPTAIWMLGSRALPNPTPLYDGSDGWVTTSPVGSYLLGASPYGVFDMDGNVAEWTDSIWAGDDVVTRGSAWTYVNTKHSHVTSRRPLNPTFRSPTLGFRCALSLSSH